MTKEIKLLAIMLLLVTPVARAQDNYVTGPELRFEAAKLARQRSAVQIYLASVRGKIEREWHPAGRANLCTAIFKVSLDDKGQVTGTKILRASKSQSYDQSIADFLKTVTVAPLPMGLQQLDLFLTFMSDSTMSMIEFAEIPEADAYYMSVVGGNLQHSGSILLAPPAPTRFTHGGGGGGPAIAVAPSVPRPQGGGGGEGIRGNPDANNNEHGRPSSSAQPDVDFGPYMADLQRRIKRAWLPPKGHEGDKVVVVFKIHKDGTMSHLRLDHSSGVAIADQAALKAVETASPLRSLPAGAQDDVDIQYTFDRNVFAGGGRGVMRSF